MELSQIENNPYLKTQEIIKKQAEYFDCTNLLNSAEEIKEKMQQLQEQQEREQELKNGQQAGQQNQQQGSEGEEGISPNQIF